MLINKESLKNNILSDSAACNYYRQLLSFKHNDK